MVSQVWFLLNNIFLVILFVAPNQLPADRVLNKIARGSKLWSGDSMESGEVQMIDEYRPMEEVRYAVFDGSAEVGRIIGRRRLQPFQMCLNCRCCSVGNMGPDLCVILPCCFGIDCSLPDKPYGVCAFVPKSCNCASCG